MVRLSYNICTPKINHFTKTENLWLWPVIKTHKKQVPNQIFEAHILEIKFEVTVFDVNVILKLIL